MGDMFEVLTNAVKPHARNVLCTIIKVDGSSYRKEGTMMLLGEDETQVGLISGGCLEEDLKYRANEVFEKETPISVVYDLSAEDDLSWGKGNGCNGTVTVLLEFITLQLKSDLVHVLENLANGVKVYWLKKISKGRVVENFFITEHRKILGHSQQLPENIEKRLEEDASGYYLHVLHPKNRLIIFGAGPDARSLVNLAAKLGYTLIITDWRPALCQEGYFHEADKIIIEEPSSFLRNFSFKKQDYIIVMTHHFEKDKIIVNGLLRKKIQYIGVLGSKTRTCRLLGMKKLPDCIFSPVGLAIGADGPNEIAVSIIAEIIKENRKRESDDCGYIFSGRPEQTNGMQ